MQNTADRLVLMGASPYLIGATEAQPMVMSPAFRRVFLLIAAFLMAAPGYAQATAEVRDKFRALMANDPAFAASRFDVERRCLEGSSTSQKCDELLQKRLDGYLSAQRVEALGMVVDARKSLLIELEFAFGLAQLGDYVRLGVLPSQANDYIARLSSNPNASDEVRDLVARLRANPRASQADKEALLAALRQSHERYQAKLADAPKEVLEHKNGMYLKERIDQANKYAELQNSFRHQ